MAVDLARLFREESGRIVASLTRTFGDLSTAEDACQEAFAAAADRWPSDGVPPSPGGWLMTTARRKALDRVRRESRRAPKELAAHRDGAPGADHGPAGSFHPDHEDEAMATSSIDDDRLRLLFTCCHPALAADARVALTLQVLGGLTAREVARAFVVPEATMNQRLVRAKAKIAKARIPYRIPGDAELPDRLGDVLRVVYLIANEGYTASRGADLLRVDLAAESLRLARLLAELMPDEAEVEGLLALLVLTDARRATRIDADGDLVPLAAQDRGRWDRGRIAEGHALVRRCLRRNHPGPFQIQAAIAAVHTDAARAEDTDWHQIVALYDQLVERTPNPVALLNRAVAIGERDGAAHGLAALDGLAEPLAGYHLFHSVTAELHLALGDVAVARRSFATARDLASNEAERRFLDRRLAECDGPVSRPSPPSGAR